MNKILIISSYSNSLINFRYELIEQLSKIYSITVLVPFDKNIKFVKKKFRNKKIDLINLNLLRNNYSLINDIKTIRNIFINIYKIKPKIIISYNIKPVIYTGIVLSVFSNIQYIPIITGLGLIL